MSQLTIGVLALQGAFSKHIAMIHSLGERAIEVKKPADLALCDALIIPGGESTVMRRQLDFIHLTEPIKDFARHKPLFGTCAGLILMSKQIVGESYIPFGLLDATVERNAFGRQSESFRSSIEISLGSQEAFSFPAVFIRAPRIRSWGKEIETLAFFDKEPVLIRQGRHLGASFHPELSSHSAIHAYFLDLVKRDGA